MKSQSKRILICFLMINHTVWTYITCSKNSESQGERLTNLILDKVCFNVNDNPHCMYGKLNRILVVTTLNTVKVLYLTYTIFGRK